MRVIEKNKNKKLVIILFVILFLLGAKLPKKNLFQSLLDISKGTIIENGVKLISEDSLGKEKSFQQILNSLDIEETEIKDYKENEKKLL
ncbi:hypothetical protein [Clostridium cochlearium]|uniref:hypothetical protein n=1 Tax=Clostridium cochlearium TaxID=1494 RepID=UPI000DF0FC50|nr:hypothetical protein [Clostridium cochlearium]STA91420.1 Uncharacterised protein [Clostridium cochlearium]